MATLSSFCHSTSLFQQYVSANYNIFFTKFNQPQNEYKHSLTFCIRCYMHLQCISIQAYVRVCCHSNETHAPIAHLPNTVQLDGTPYYSSKLHPGPCSSVEMQQGTDKDTETAMANIHFASAIPHAKCNKFHCFLMCSADSILSTKATDQSQSRIPPEKLAGFQTCLNYFFQPTLLADFCL